MTTYPGATSALHVILTVCSEFKLSTRELMTSRRPERIAFPRQVAMHLVREICGWSLHEVARVFGRDHTTILHASRRVQGRMDTEPALRERVARITERAVAILKGAA